MKKLKILLGVIIGAVVVGAGVGDDIHWPTPKTKLYINQDDYYELGFRKDGVVVWRLITIKKEQTVIKTNSPAEQVEIKSTKYYWWPDNSTYLTNIVTTNLLYIDNSSTNFIP